MIRIMLAQGTSLASNVYFCPRLTAPHFVGVLYRNRQHLRSEQAQRNAQTFATTIFLFLWLIQAQLLLVGIRQFCNQVCNGDDRDTCIH